MKMNYLLLRIHKALINRHKRMQQKFGIHNWVRVCLGYNRVVVIDV